MVITSKGVFFSFIVKFFLLLIKLVYKGSLAHNISKLLSRSYDNNYPGRERVYLLSGKSFGVELKID